MKSIIKFLHEARTELAKVTWPTRNAAINMTLAVMMVALVITVYTAGVDYLLTQGIKLLTVASQTNSQQQPLKVNPLDVGDIKVNTQ